MPLYRVATEGLQRVTPTTFAQEGLRERGDLQRLLKADISVLAADLMIVSEEFGDWEDSRRRIDLLCLDKQARLVVVELKRTEDGGHMELQALRYAAMVSSMTFAQLMSAHAREIGGDDAQGRSEQALLKFLGWSTATEAQLSTETRIILVASNFSVELTTAVLWLNRQGLDLTCYRIVPHKFEDTVLVDIQQLIPLPEAADYETKLREQREEIKRVESSRKEIFRRFWAQLVERSKTKTQVVAGRTTSGESWIAGASGKAGFGFNFVMTREVSRVELYIDLGKTKPQQTLEAYRHLEARKAEIEARFGGELQWQDLPDSRGCRIAFEQPGGWRTSEDGWPELQDRLVAEMVRLEAAVRPELSSLR